MAGDETVGAELARSAGLPVETADMVLEGGALDADGAGTALVTEQCLLHANRGGVPRETVAAALAKRLGLSRIVWLGDGLAGDHTDGHVDNLARFVAPGRVALPEPAANDPNAAAYADAARRLRAAGLEVVRVPSPGAVTMGGGPAPASLRQFRGDERAWSSCRNSARRTTRRRCARWASCSRTGRPSACPLRRCWPAAARSTAPRCSCRRGKDSFTERRQTGAMARILDHARALAVVGMAAALIAAGPALPL